MLMLDAAAEGMGVALAVDGLAEEMLETGTLVRLFPQLPPASLGIFLVWRSGNPKVPRIHALRDWLVAEAAAEAARGGKAHPRP